MVVVFGNVDVVMERRDHQRGVGLVRPGYAPVWADLKLKQTLDHRAVAVLGGSVQRVDRELGGLKT